MRGRLAELWDRIVASDPGLTRLRSASHAAIAMAGALGVEALYAAVIHASAQATLIAMLLGAIVAMMGSMALASATGWTRPLIAAFFPVAIGVGVLAGVAAGGRTDVMLSVFVAVMFVAVFVRRFGPPFFFYGFMAWMGYFFAASLHATWAAVPGLLAATTVGAGWVLLLSVTVLRGNRSRTLRRTVRAFDARARAVARAGADLLRLDTAVSTADGLQRRMAQRRLRTRQARLAEVALMVEAWSAEPGALPAGWSAPALRRRLLDAHQTVDDLASAAQSLVGGLPALVEAAAAVMDRLARRQDREARVAAQRLAEEVGDSAEEPSHALSWAAARQIAAAAAEFVRLAGSADFPPVDDDEAEFAPVVSLAMGNLPGASAVAGEFAARGTRWNPLARRTLVTRQAVQVSLAGALAIVVGRQLSPERYYWAVIAAFVMFSGTATRADTFIKGLNRVAGTLIGLFASIWIAQLTTDSTTLVLVVIVGSMFLGLYFVQVSYLYMIFFVTILVGQLYSVLHEFSGDLLVLRLEETAIGAAVGFVVALIVVPLSTRDTVHSARNELLQDLAAMLDAIGQILGNRAESTVDATAGPPAVPNLDQLARGLDDRLRRLALVARPLTRPIVLGNSSPRTRHRLVLYAAVASHARGLSVAVRHAPYALPEPALACRALADAARELTLAQPGRPQPSAAEPLAIADRALLTAIGEGPGADVFDPITRPLVHISRALRELAGIEPPSLTNLARPPTPAPVPAVASPQ